MADDDPYEDPFRIQLPTLVLATKSDINRDPEEISVFLELIESTWPDTDAIVLRPDSQVLSAARPNPMSVEASIPTFLRTLAFLRRELAESHIWDLVEKHLVRR